MNTNYLRNCTAVSYFFYPAKKNRGRCAHSIQDFFSNRKNIIKKSLQLFSMQACLGTTHPINRFCL